LKQLNDFEFTEYLRYKNRGLMLVMKDPLYQSKHTRHLEIAEQVALGVLQHNTKFQVKISSGKRMEAFI